MRINSTDTDIDLLARSLAAKAGVVWDRLETYPGYLRNRWREDARKLLQSLAPGALSAN